MHKRYRHDWVLFADWGAAADHPSLPAVTEAQAQFLHEHPAAVTTQKRRVSAVSAVHLDNHLPARGRSTEVPRIFHGTRAARRGRAAAAPARRRTPTTGWPAGLFGRRDALLLVLAATGMTFTQISGLRRGDVTVDDCTPSSPRQEASISVCQFPPATPWPPTRWVEVLAFLDRHPNTQMLARHLTTDPGPVLTIAPTGSRASQPVPASDRPMGTPRRLAPWLIANRT
ncbi:hypothetical protein [Rhodococcus olei]|uniref:hypothetical protein n=1 Tax=Rhodococcus olei TaxID=2161675 RepID=UPI0031E57DD4